MCIRDRPYVTKKQNELESLMQVWRDSARSRKLNGKVGDPWASGLNCGGDCVHLDKQRKKWKCHPYGNTLQTTQSDRPLGSCFVTHGYELHICKMLHSQGLSTLPRFAMRLRLWKICFLKHSWPPLFNISSTTRVRKTRLDSNKSGRTNDEIIWRDTF